MSASRVQPRPPVTIIYNFRYAGSLPVNNTNTGASSHLFRISALEPNAFASRSSTTTVMLLLNLSVRRDVSRFGLDKQRCADSEILRKTRFRAKFVCFDRHCQRPPGFSDTTITTCERSQIFTYDPETRCKSLEEPAEMVTAEKSENE